MKNASTVSVWLEPADGQFCEDMNLWIKALSEYFGTVPFLPHVTAVGGFAAKPHEALVACDGLARMLPVQQLTFTKLGFRSVWNQAAFLQAHPSAELMHMYEMATKAFSLDDDSYMPHASLLYGTPGEEERRSAVGELDIELPITARFDHLALWITDLSDIGSWSRVERFRLQEH